MKADYTAAGIRLCRAAQLLENPKSNGAGRQLPRAFPDGSFFLRGMESTFPIALSVIQRAFNRPVAALEHVRVDHGGIDILVTEQFLHGADIVAILEKLGGKSMPEGVWGNGFVQACGNYSLLDGFLDHSDIQVMASGTL